MTHATTQTMTIKDASDKLGVTIRTLQRQIKQGKYKSKLRKGKRYVTFDTTNDAPMSQQNVAPPQPQQTAQMPTIPQGYVLLPQQTLDVLQAQVKELNSKLTKVMDTQQLLIERGLNLKQLPPVNATTTTTTQARQDSDNVVVDVADKPKPKDKKHSDKHHDTNKKMSQDMSQPTGDNKNAPQATTEVKSEPVKRKGWWDKPFWEIFKK